MNASSYLNHPESPLTPEALKTLEATVVKVARRLLVGRRFIDLYGPLGAGVQTVPYDEYEGASAGSVDLVGTEESGLVFPNARKFKTIPIIHKDFLLHWRDLEASRGHKLPIDFSAAAGAAAFCAQMEDELIFYGNEKMGFEGLMNAKGRLSVSLDDWTTPGSGFQNLVAATQKLNESGHFGPYAFVLSPPLFAQLHRVYEKTGVLEIETLRQLATDGVFQSTTLRGDSAVVVSTGAENLDIAVAMDMSVSYLGPDRMNHPFRVFEMLLPRIKHADAICTMEKPK